MTLLSLAVKCPACGRRPNQRIFPAAKAKYADDPDDAPVVTWRCQKCGEVSIITAKAYKRAS